MGRISQETLERIAAANDIVDVIGSYFPLRRAGGTFRALCPFHQEKTPSFHVNPSRQRYHCFGCGADGSVFRFVMEYEHVDFVAAVRRLAERAAIPLSEQDFGADEDPKFRLRKRLVALHAEAADWYHRNLLKSPAAKGARAYLKGRGIGSEIAKAWKIGYAPDEWDACRQWACGKGYTVAELMESGLLTAKEEEGAQRPGYDRFRGRIMFPICNDRGEVIGFSGRVLDPDAKAAKYVNSPETILFIKGNILFGLHRSKRALIDRNSAIVCGGQLDLITAFEAGVQNVIAPQGTAFTERQARLLKRYVEEVILCFDSDAAGEKAAERSLPALLDANLFVRVAEIPAPHDPDSLIRTEGVDAFMECIRSAQDFFEYQVSRAMRDPEWGTPRGKVRLARKVAEYLGLVADAAIREAVLQKVSARIGLPAADLRGMLSSGRRPAGGVARGIGEAPQSPPLKRPEKTVAWLCNLAAHHAGARRWLLERPWKQTLAEIPDSEWLAAILEADIRPAEPVTLAAFLAERAQEEERLLGEIFREHLSGDPMAMAAACWRTLELESLDRRLRTLTSSMAVKQVDPGVAPGEILEIQREYQRVYERRRALIEEAG